MCQVRCIHWLVDKPEIRSDNGSGYISKEFKIVLQENGLGHHRIKPHCPARRWVDSCIAPGERSY